MRALIVEDDGDIRNIIDRAMRQAGFETVSAADGLEGDLLASDGGFDVAILDWNVPGMEGLEIVRRLREAHDKTPVVILTARDALEDRVEGLDAGADDYLLKPFLIEELLARVRSVIRRSGSQASSTFSEGGLILNIQSRTATTGGRGIPLSAREYELLEYFMRNADVALSRQDIEEHIWGTTFESTSNVLDVMVGRVRRKLAAHDLSPIETVRGHGYRFKRVAEGV
ncbi:MAG: response regulator transcription factor [Candidatus Eremiobacteraeota bacterium]|nr:response regulator transcription factor [Candidatus Eremiobacteraeota bacterium]